MDIARFTAVNTAKGPWSLLRLLSSTKKTAEPSLIAEAPPPVAAPGIIDVQKIIKEVAAGIIGVELKGSGPYKY